MYIFDFHLDSIIQISLNAHLRILAFKDLSVASIYFDLLYNFLLRY